MIGSADDASFDADVLSRATPTLVAFSAVWCRPCRVLDRQLELLAEDHPEIDVRRVDVDENPTLVERYGVMTVPTVVLFRAGEVAATMTGPMTERLLEIGLGLDASKRPGTRTPEGQAEVGAS